MKITDRKARKSFKCARCRETVNINDHYKEIVYSDEKHTTLKVCLDCWYPKNFVESSDAHLIGV